MLIFFELHVECNCRCSQPEPHLHWAALCQFFQHKASEWDINICTWKCEDQENNVLLSANNIFFSCEKQETNCCQVYKRLPANTSLLQKTACMLTNCQRLLTLYWRLPLVTDMWMDAASVDWLLAIGCRGRLAPCRRMPVKVSAWPLAASRLSVTVMDHDD